MDNVVIPRVEMTARSITQSSRRGPSSTAQNPDQRDFSEKTANIPLFSVSGRVDLNINQGKNDEARFVENFEDSDFLASRLNYDRQAHSHHK